MIGRVNGSIRVFFSRLGGPLTLILRQLVIKPNDVKPDTGTNSQVTLGKSNVYSGFRPDGDVEVDFAGLDGQVWWQYLDDGVELGGVNRAPSIATHQINFHFRSDWNRRLESWQSPTSLASMPPSCRCRWMCLHVDLCRNAKIHPDVYAKVHGPDGVAPGLAGFARAPSGILWARRLCTSLFVLRSRGRFPL